MKVRYYADRYPGQNLEDIYWSRESQAAVSRLYEHNRRIWIEIDVPTDKQLWPENFVGENLYAPIIKTESSK